MLAIRRFAILGVALSVVATGLMAEGWLTPSQTASYSSYLTTFNTKYDTSATKLNACATCHSDESFGLNAYGDDLEAQAGSVDAKLTAVEALDSDGDGISNIDEINAATWPGDASDPGSSPTPTPTPVPAPITVTSVFAPSAPVLDGTVEALWDQATAVNIPVANGVNMGSTTVSMRSLYTADSVYFLFDYADPTESQQRMPWQKQANGTWEKLSTSTTHSENTYYEDKVALLWDINIAGFAQGGCAILCHAGEQPANSDYGSKYTTNPGEMGDIWHWKSVRTNVEGQVDDQYVNSDRYDPATAPGAGRHADPKTGGGYFNNENAAKTMPAYTDPHQPAPPYWIRDADKQTFVDVFQTGDEIAGIITAAITGDRGDISGKGVYANGRWYLEVGRKLTTASDKDVQFSDLAEVYHFGVAVFDNAQVHHAYQSGGAARLVFAPAGESVIWGDANCSGSANPVDSLLTLRHDAGLSTSTGDCPDMGSVVDVQNASQHPWGDVDCGGEVTPVDSLKLLRYDAGYDIAQSTNCPEVGSEVRIVAPAPGTTATSVFAHSAPVLMAP